MKLLKRKPIIKVIGVRHETRNIVTENERYMSYNVSQRKKQTEKNVSYTIVLLSKDGELCTKEFNGTWDLKDVKKWEDL